MLVSHLLNPTPQVCQEVEEGEPLKCPVCDATVIDEKGSISQCPHVEFILDPEGEFRTASDAIQDLVATKRKAAERNDEDFSTLDLLDEISAGVVIYAWTSYGIACPQ